MDIQQQLEIINSLIESNNSRESGESTTERFKSASWFDSVKETSVLVAGIGGIGSWFSLLLSRMHPKSIVLMDDDIVEIANLSGQLYSIDDIGNFKVEALRNTIFKYSAYANVVSLNRKFTSLSEAYDIMICGFDNMEARKTYFFKWLERVKSTPIEDRYKLLFIDGRLNAEKFQVISITGTDYYGMQKYAKEYLFEDSVVAEALCSYKQTTYCAAMIASFMCNSFINFLCHSDERPVLFFQEYDATFMSLKQES